MALDPYGCELGDRAGAGHIRHWIPWSAGELVDGGDRAIGPMPWFEDIAPFSGDDGNENKTIHRKTKRLHRDSRGVYGIGSISTGFTHRGAPVA
ncbi:MAG: hypothetical protein Fur0042_25090 [Cyanophyceae cyanobacterium]